MNTYHVRLTRASDGMVITGLLAEQGSDGAPSLELGSFAYSADVAGRPGRIVIPSFHHGSGQRTALDPLKYEDAGGFNPTRPGHLLANFEELIPTLLTGAYPLVADTARGTIFNFYGIRILITPEQIWEDTTLVDTAAAGTRFTGGYAIWGDRIFFGRENKFSVYARETTVTCRVKSGGTYHDAGIGASFFTIIGEKLFRVRSVLNGAAQDITVDWTDQINTDTPLFSTAYTVRRSVSVGIMDLNSLGPNIVLALGGIVDVPGELLTMDNGGTFTDLLPMEQGYPGILRLIPWQGGLAVIFSGSIQHSVFFPDLTTFQPIRLHSNLLGFEMTMPYGTAATGAPSILIASDLNNLYLAPPTLRIVENAILVTADDEGVFTHHKTLPNFLPAAGHILTARLTVSSVNDQFLEVAYLSGTPKDDLNIVSIPLWSGNAFPSLGTCGTDSFFQSSEYLGDSQGLKQFVGMGFTTRLHNSGAALNENLITKLQMQRVGAVITLPTLTASDNPPTLGVPVWFELEKSAIGRSVSFSFEFNDPNVSRGIIDIECPIIIDYFEVPAARDSIVLGLVAGSLQVTRTGTFTKKSRRQTLDDVQTALLNPSRWTLDWWDGRAAWQVIPTGFRTQETEGQARPGEGAAFVQLELRRLPDASRVVPTPTG